MFLCFQQSSTLLRTGLIFCSSTNKHPLLVESRTNLAADFRGVRGVRARVFPVIDADLYIVSVVVKASDLFFFAAVAGPVVFRAHRAFLDSRGSSRC